MQNKKIAYIQWLRVFAAFAVVLMHTAAKNWFSVPPGSAEWRSLTLWDSLVRWPVPVFVMITGALFLPKKISLSDVLRRYIPRLVLAWLVWSGIHALYAGGTPGELLQRFLAGHYHLWYLPFLCGVYLALPFVQKIAEDDRLTKQLLLVSALIALVIPWLADAAAFFFPEAAGLLGTVKNHLNFSFFFDHLSILLLGHVLHQTELSPRARGLIYAAGIGGVAVTGAATIAASEFAGAPLSLFFNHAAPNTLCAAAAVFVFAKYHLTRLPKAVDYLAKCSFGVYLCHAFFIDLLADRGIHALARNPLWATPALAAAIFAASILLTAVISKIPFVGKILT